MPMPASYVVSDTLLAGAYPGSANAVTSLEQAGVSVFVDLTHPSDPLDNYGHLLRSARRVAHPIPDMGTPTTGLVMRILDEIDTAQAGNDTVYVHCWGGVGRTGTVIGCWLARHGLDTGDPVARIAELRAGISGASPSPETPGQIELVRGWRRGW
jgi:protein-tyrosine phosphatase